MIELVALGLVAGTGVFFLALGATALLRPARAVGFLRAFASTPGKHYLELVIRLLMGAAFVGAAPNLPATEAFALFGWVLLVTSAVMLLLPFRWHQRFARSSVPEALRFLPLIGLSSLLLGSAVFWAVFYRVFD